MKLVTTIGLLYFAATVSTKPYLPKENDTLRCGYQFCPTTDPDRLNVHLIAHSHDDLGWLKTVDKYFYKQVQYIIGSVVDALLRNPDRRFIQVETAYFFMWWSLQDDDVKTTVKQLINEGRLEIINGGWSMNDEAATQYQSTIDQFTLGHRWLVENFGECGITKTGWQIDPFGHSREQASIYSQMGFDSFFLMRFDYRDSDKRKREKTMDLLWKGSENLDDTNIFTSTFARTTYAWPVGFCYDITCGDADIVGDRASPEFDFDKVVADFAGVIAGQAQYYPTNNIYITMGDDVHYTGAHKNFANIDRLIRGIKERNPKVNGKELNVFYSTPSCYTKAVNDYVNKENYILDYKTDDFMPLITENDGCWTGFFTSRPTSKRYERISNHVLQVAKQITAMAGFPQSATFNLASAVGIMQHHDAITGTQMQDVEKDYHRLLHAGISDSIMQISKALTQLLGLEDDISLSYCPLANVSICQPSKTDNFKVLLYNPLGRTVTHYMQVPVDGGTWKVTDPEGNSVSSYLHSPVRNFQFVADNIGQSLNENVLMFKAENLPPLGYKIYEIVKSSQELLIPVNHPEFETGDASMVGYEKNYVILDETTGFVKIMAINGFEVNVTPKIMFYYSDWGSGTYMFKPDVNRRDPVSFSDQVENQITKSDLSVEIRQEMRDWGILTVRIYPDTDYIEIDWVAGPIDVGDETGKDVIIKYTTDLETNSIFYTDSNSRELIQRKRNFRPTFEYTNGEPQSGNYYPITSRIVLRDENKNVEFAVVTDRAEGGSSLNDGEIELMVHRATLRDELSGEHLYEMEYGTGLIARGSHYITFGPIVNTETDARSSSYIQRNTAIRKHLPPLLLFPNNPVPAKTVSYLTRDLPDNIHLLTFEKWNDDDNTYVIRLEHFLEKNDDTTLSKEVEVDLENLFTTFRIVSADERTLNGISPLKDVTNLKWHQLNEDNLSRKGRNLRALTDLKITLTPMQIRTFVVTIESASSKVY